MPSRGRVCFATPGVYPLLIGQPVAVNGGSEARALKFLRALEKEDRHDLSLIAFDHRAGKSSAIGGIRIIRDPVYAVRPKNHFARARSRLLAAARLVEIKAASYSAAWECADAQVYVAFGVGNYSAMLARWTEDAGRHLVLVAGSDSDFSAEYQSNAAGRNFYGSDLALCGEAVRRAGTIVVQTRVQRCLAAERFGRAARVIGNPMEFDDAAVEGVPDRPAGHALWIGKSDRIKRPNLVHDLARRCPDITFKMVVNPVDRALFNDLRRSRPENVQLIEQASAREVANLFAGAFCMLNTSMFEGFPNTFLEAGRHAVPVISLAVDPDGIIAAHDAGAIVHGDLDAMSAALRIFNEDRARAREAGRNLRRHVRFAHEAGARLSEFSRLIDELIERRSAVL